MLKDITVQAIRQDLMEEVLELQAEPEFQRVNGSDYAVDSKGFPQVKVAIANVPLEYDLWEGLRNPAVVGLYPVGLPEIWEFYANRRKQKVDETGRQTIFQVPRSFEFALKNYRRAIIISVMLPFSPGIVHDYTNRVIGSRNGSSSIFAAMYERLNRMLDKAITRTAINLVTDESERAVVVMNNDNAKAVSTEAIPQTRQGTSHGPSKGCNYPQKSLAVLTGLGQFGVSRMVMRDEIINNKVERFVGPIRSIIAFDNQPFNTDGKDGIIYPVQEWRQFLFQLFDFTNTDVDINRYRFCSHISQDRQACNQCIAGCPSGAMESSSPQSDGHYSKKVARQAHLFWDNKLQFDGGKCNDERGQMSGLFSEWSCGRCLTNCLDKGIRRKQAVQSYYKKIDELARPTEPKPVLKGNNK